MTILALWATLAGCASVAHLVSSRRVGGLIFVRVGPFGASFYRTRKPLPARGI